MSICISNNHGPRCPGEISVKKNNKNYKGP